MRNQLPPPPQSLCNYDNREFANCMVWFIHMAYSILTCVGLARSEKTIVFVFCFIHMFLLFGFIPHMSQTVKSLFIAYVATLLSYIYCIFIGESSIFHASLILAGCSFILITGYVIVRFYDIYRDNRYNQLVDLNEKYPLLLPIPVVIEVDAR